MNSSFVANELGRHNFKHICTDGAPEMLGVRRGLVALVKKELPHVTSSHCSLYRYALAYKTHPQCLMEVTDIAVKVINFIRTRAKSYRLFQLLAKEMAFSMFDVKLDVSTFSKVATCWVRWTDARYSPM